MTSIDRGLTLLVFTCQAQWVTTLGNALAYQVFRHMLDSKSLIRTSGCMHSLSLLDPVVINLLGQSGADLGTNSSIIMALNSVLAYTSHTRNHNFTYRVAGLANALPVI